MPNLTKSQAKLAAYEKSRSLDRQAFALVDAEPGLAFWDAYAKVLDQCDAPMPDGTCGGALQAHGAYAQCEECGGYSECF